MSEQSQRPVIGFLRQLRKYFFSGIATIFPVFITLYTFILVFRFMDNMVGKYLNIYFLDNYGYTIPGLGFIISIAMIVCAGFLANHFFGKKVFPFFERLFMKIPFVEHIYPPAKQLSNFLFNEDQHHRFKHVVLVQFPEPRTYAMGFMTNEMLLPLNQKAGEDLVIVLVPTPPSPFSGMLLCVPREKVRILDISIEQAIKFIVSGGIAASFTGGNG